MGRKRKDWSLKDIHDWFRARPDRCATWRELKMAVNGHKYPERWSMIRALVLVDGAFLHKQTDATNKRDKREIAFRPEFYNAAEEARRIHEQHQAQRRQAQGSTPPEDSESLDEFKSPSEPSV